MAVIDFATRDYILANLDEAFTVDVVQSICSRLNIHRGKYWANPNLGSRFYTLRRSKDVPRMVALVKQIADEALFGLVPSRLTSIVTIARQRVPSRIDLQIDVVRLTGEKQTVTYFVAVGG